jgi:hypothetical protein
MFCGVCCTPSTNHLYRQGSDTPGHGGIRS